MSESSLPQDERPPCLALVPSTLAEKSYRPSDEAANCEEEDVTRKEIETRSEAMRKDLQRLTTRLNKFETELQNTIDGDDDFYASVDKFATSLDAFILDHLQEDNRLSDLVNVDSQRTRDARLEYDALALRFDADVRPPSPTRMREFVATLSVYAGIVLSVVFMAPLHAIWSICTRLLTAAGILQTRTRLHDRSATVTPIGATGAGGGGRGRGGDGDGGGDGLVRVHNHPRRRHSSRAHRRHARDALPPSSSPGSAALSADMSAIDMRADAASGLETLESESAGGDDRPPPLNVGPLLLKSPKVGNQHEESGVNAHKGIETPQEEGREGAVTQGHDETNTNRKGHGKSNNKVVNEDENDKDGRANGGGVDNESGDVFVDSVGDMVGDGSSTGGRGHGENDEDGGSGGRPGWAMPAEGSGMFTDYSQFPSADFWHISTEEMRLESLKASGSTLK